MNATWERAICAWLKWSIYKKCNAISKKSCFRASIFMQRGIARHWEGFSAPFYAFIAGPVCQARELHDWSPAIRCVPAIECVRFRHAAKSSIFIQHIKPIFSFQIRMKTRYISCFLLLVRSALLNARIKPVHAQHSFPECRLRFRVPITQRHCQRAYISPKSRAVVSVSAGSYSTQIACLRCAPFALVLIYLISCCVAPSVDTLVLLHSAAVKGTCAPVEMRCLYCKGGKGSLVLLQSLRRLIIGRKSTGRKWVDLVCLSN